MLDEEFVEKIRKMPEFEAFINAVNEKLTLENGYVEHFAPEKHQVEEEKEEGGRRYFHYLMSESKREEDAVEKLLEDKSGWFDDFIHDELMRETTELCRALIKLERGL